MAGGCQGLAVRRERQTGDQALVPINRQQFLAGSDVPQTAAAKSIKPISLSSGTCGESVHGSHPLQTSDALGAAASQLGPDTQAAITCYHIDPQRSCDALQRILGIDWSGILVHDGWASYDQLEEAANRRLAAHLDAHGEQWFLFLLDPVIPPTNCRGEQAIRPAVVNRKVLGNFSASQSVQFCCRPCIVDKTSSTC